MTYREIAAMTGAALAAVCVTFAVGHPEYSPMTHGILWGSATFNGLSAIILAIMRGR